MDRWLCETECRRNYNTYCYQCTGHQKISPSWHTVFLVIAKLMLRAQPMSGYVHVHNITGDIYVIIAVIVAVHLFVWTCLFLACLSVCLSICLSVYLSVCGQLQQTQTTQTSHADWWTKDENTRRTKQDQGDNPTVHWSRNNSLLLIFSRSVYMGQTSPRTQT